MKKFLLRTSLEHTIIKPGEDMHLLLASRPNAAMVRLLMAPVLEQLISLAREQYDYVIIDTPPQSYFADSQRISDLADAALLVVRQDVAPAPEINDAMDALRAGKAEFMGYVLNDMQHLLSGSSEYGYRYGSRYYGRYNRYGKYGKYAANPGKYEKTKESSDQYS